MTPEAWNRICAAFHDVLNLPLCERNAYLDRECEGNLSLRKAILDMLDADDAFDESPLLNRLLETVEHQKLGAFRLRRRIGQGGMGTVYVATRDDFLQRVAIKVLRNRLDDPAVVRRLHEEAKLLAALDHPNIARFIDGGTAYNGRPYFVMDYVDGRPIDQYAEECRIPLIGRLRLFLPVCSAVQHAHDRNVIHRDLKPDNILVTPDGVPKLLDFGIAAVLYPALSFRKTTDTDDITRFLTLRYASPEQVAEERSLTKQSDVYSLGVVLYELIASRPPYVIDGLSRADAIRTIRETIPPPPSLSLPRRERRKLPRDLDIIVLKTLAKLARDRYSTVSALSDDIERCLHGDRSLARPLTRARLGGAWLREKVRVSRYAITIGASLVIAIMLILLVAMDNRRTNDVTQQLLASESGPAFLRGLHCLASGSTPQELRMPWRWGRALAAGELWASIPRHLDRNAFDPLLDGGLATLDQDEKEALIQVLRYLTPAVQDRSSLGALAAIIDFAFWNDHANQRAARQLRALVRLQLEHVVGSSCPELPESLPNGRESFRSTWVRIPAGEFRMGCDPDQEGEPLEKDEVPVHSVSVAEFLMLSHEVTASMYNAFDGERIPVCSEKPAAEISWYEAYAFAAWCGGRLPSEAEWEYAARAGQAIRTRFPGSNEEQSLLSSGWHNANADETQDVGQLKANAWGLFDTHGNVYEWCMDNYEPYTQSIGRVLDPLSMGGGERRVERGGAYNEVARYCTSSNRAKAFSRERLPDVGFRVVRTTSLEGAQRE